MKVRNFQSYRGTWAWLTQRISAILLFLLIPLKIYSGWATKGKVPFPDWMGASRKVHFNSAIDILLLLCFLLHGFYGLRVILIDFGIIKEDKLFWRTLTTVLTIFAATVYYVYIREE